MSELLPGNTATDANGAHRDTETDSHTFLGICLGGR